MNKNDVVSLLKNKKFQWAVVGIVLLIVLFWSSSIRVSNWDLLTDQTTGEKIPIALDPFYFLRLAETIVENGSLPEVDVMRYPSANVSFSSEIMPQVIVGMYNVANVFGDYTLREVDIFSPVVFYFVGVVLFFFLIFVLTKSKSIAVISSIFLGFIPSYLYRTMAGFSDHEAIGMMSLFAAMLVYTLGLKWIDKNKNLVKAGLFGLGAAFLSALTIASWGGVATFIFMIFPLAFLVFWLMKIREDAKFVKRGIAFYSSWIILVPLCGLILGYSAMDIINRFMLGSEGMISLFVLAFIIIDALLIKYREKFSFVKEKFRAAYSFGIALVLGFTGLALVGRSVFSLLSNIWLQIFHPWGTGRVGLTVAENAQPYLTDWIAQTGNLIFWMFFAGTIFVGFEIAKKIKSRKRGVLFVLFWAVMISSALFSRISPSSMMNGINFISQVVYAGGMLVSLGFFAWLYFKEDFNIRPGLIFVGAWLFFILLSGRAAQRMFFAIAPFMCFMAAFFVVKLWEYCRGSRDKVAQMVLGILLIVSVLGAVNTVYDFEKDISVQASQTGPSAHYQWQGAMSWVRDNTNEGDIFVHWWDYGYWVEYLGERPSVTDGGHAVTHWDHFIGRYLLTTPRPETAYSFMKTHDVSYLLIDPTDLGKYGAYSKIGSGEDGTDRYSAVPVMVMDAGQTRESANETIVVYSGGVPVDEDIMYPVNGKDVFLPASRAVMAGVIWRIGSIGDSSSLGQPIGVYYYNNQRYDIPLRYVYTDAGLADFGNGLDAVVRIIPSLEPDRINRFGAAIYLSPKVSKGLFARLYLMNDAFGDYGDIKLAHSEDDGVVQSLKSQGFDIKDFVYYGGFRGPIKIWEIGYPEGTLEREEFLRTSGEWAEFDDLEFVA